MGLGRAGLLRSMALRLSLLQTAHGGVVRAGLGVRWRFAYLTPDGAREVCTVFDPAVHLHCASLHVGHGLRPMKKCKQKSAYVQAQRKFLLAFFRTAHCLREKKGHNFL